MSTEPRSETPQDEVKSSTEPNPDRLADHTTLRLGGPARAWVTATTEAELIEAVSAADAVSEPVLVLGGGSNLVVADDGFPGTVVEVATAGIEADHDGDGPTCGGVLVTVAAGETWDDLVATAVAKSWVGVEALSGIPGSVGATPIQNVGAYGQEVAQTVASVRVWDRRERTIRTYAAADCDFGYRTSRFKRDRYDAYGGAQVVLAVTFQFRIGDASARVAYAELARTLGVDIGRRAPLAQVREAVLGLRRGKGMVLDPADHDTWSAGSFFTNPIVAAATVPDGCAVVADRPAGPGEDQRRLADRPCRVRQGPRSGRRGRWGLPVDQAPLALTNRGAATTDDLLGLAREVRQGVLATYGIELVNEPVLVGCAL